MKKRVWIIALLTGVLLLSGCSAVWRVFLNEYLRVAALRIISVVNQSLALSETGEGLK